MNSKDLDKLIEELVVRNKNGYKAYSSYGQFKELSYLEQLNRTHETTHADRLKELRRREERLRRVNSSIDALTKKVVERKRKKKREAKKRAEKLYAQEDFKFRKFVGELTPQEKLMQRVNTWRGLRWAGFSTSIIYTIISLSILL